MLRVLRTAKNLVKQYGWRGLLKATKNKLMGRDLLYGFSIVGVSNLSVENAHFAEQRGYMIWKKQREEADQTDQEAEIASFKTKPLISVIMPLYNAPVKYLELAIESIQKQTYTNWELCMVDDGSKDLRCVRFAEEKVKSDPRVRFQRCERNGGISAASNVALEMAAGEYIALIDQDDVVPNDAFFWFVKEINQHPDADFLYSDECKTDASEKIVPSCYYFKPDWSQFLLLNHMYTGHLTLYRTSLVRQIGGFRSQFDFSQDYDLALRMGDATTHIYHIERLLYYWRIIPSSGASGGKSFARITNIAATHDWYKRHGIEVTHDTVDALSNFGQVKHVSLPLVSVVIPTDSLKMLGKCIDGINGPSTSYHNVEIIPVTNSLVAEKILQEYPYFENINVRCYDEIFNFSRKCNEGAKIAKGKYIVFYNDDVYPRSQDWIERMLDLFSHPGVGGVSPAMLLEDGRIQYAGMITGTPGLVGTAFNGQPFFENVPTVFKQYLVRDVSVLSGACMMVERDTFFAIGGFDEENTPNGHSDTDISFKLLDASKKCVYTPFSMMTHIGNHSWEEKKKKDKSDIFCLKKWGKYISNDKFFTHSMREGYYHDFPDEYQIYYPENYMWDFNHTGRDVLFVTHELSRTGAPIVLLSAVRAAIENGDFVVVVSPEDGKLREEFLRAGAILIVDEMARKENWMFQRFARNFDVVVCNTLATYWAVAALKNSIVPVMWWIHESAFAFEYFKKFIPRNAGTNVYSYAVSDYTKELMDKYGIQCCGKLMFGVDDFSEIFGSPESNENCFIVAGTIEQRKAQDIALSAFLDLPTQVRAQSKLAFYGNIKDEEIAQEIRNAVKDGKENILLLNNAIKHDDLMRKCRDSIAIVVPSRDEPVSMVAVEAMSLSKPCIVSDKTGISSYITDGVDGLIFESGNVSQLREKMMQLLNDKDFSRKMGENGRKLYEREFAYGNFKKNFKEVIDMILTGKPKFK